jgi:phosphatidylserine/phosphatidylglycerophosphate/cardiolipin synthase-like enzyme
MHHHACALAYAGLWTLLCLFTTPSPAKEHPIHDFSSFAPHYEAQFGHSLSLKKETRFYADDNWLYPERWFEQSNEDHHQVFSFDPNSFMNFKNHEDFLSAKIAHYDQFNFSKKRQEYRLSYPAYFYWNGLFHPPMTLSDFSSDLKKIDKAYRNPASSNHEFLTSDYQAEIDSKTKTEMTFSNQLNLLKNRDSIEHKIALVKSTQNYFYASVMVFACGKKELELATAMASAATAGKDIRLMVEGLYSPVFSRCLKVMRKGGVKVVYSLDSLNPKNPISLLHNKFWIQDGKEAILGGQNMSSSQNKADGKNHYYRDTDVAIKGPLVTDLMDEFSKLWERHTTRHPLSEFKRSVADRKNLERLQGLRGTAAYPEHLDKPFGQINGACRVVFQGPQNERRTVGELYWELLQKTKNSFTLTSPIIRFDPKIIKGKYKFQESSIWPDRMADYLIRNPHIKGNIISNGSLANGADMTVVLWDQWKKALAQGKNTKARLFQKLMVFFARQRSRSNIESMALLRRHTGLMPWYHYSFAHQKIAVFDGIVTSIGSFNMDSNSARFNHEMTMLCSDPKLQVQVDEMLYIDMVNSIPVPWPGAIR